MSTIHAAESRQHSAIIIGARGGIGAAMLRVLEADDSIERVFAISRETRAVGEAKNEKTVWLKSDSSEESMAKICKHIAGSAPSVKYLIVTIGTLHDEDQKRFPEKRLEELEQHQLSDILRINATLPLLWLKSLSLLFNKQSDTRIAVLSARVGSITDNELGGWYGYRASKAALNMLLKTLAIEYRRRFPEIKLTAFHPGTTETALSEPFRANVPPKKLFKPEFVASQLMAYLQASEADGELSFVDWEHKAIPW